MPFKKLTTVRRRGVTLDYYTEPTPKQPVTAQAKAITTLRDAAKRGRGK